MKTPLVLLAAILATGHAGELPFLRGMGWSPWHATHGWNRPPEVVAEDYRLLAEMRVNALRTWGGSKRANLERQFAEHGLYLVPQVGNIPGPPMAFADGKPGHPAYVHPEALAALAERAGALAKELAGAKGLAAYNLGNEYSWVGTDKDGRYQYQGFDEATLAAFRKTLQERFGDIANWRRLTGREDTDFASILPPRGQNDSLLFWEWWRFQREAFGCFLRAGHAAIHAADPETPVTYALLCGNRWDAATEDADLPFLELQGDNLYYHWDQDWVKYAIRLSRRIGPGRPILVTETGVNTQRYPDPIVAARLMRQMLWTLLLHSEVKGVFPFVFCDEWWHGEDPKAPDTTGDYWGVLTADRKPKSTYHAVRETYAAWERLAPVVDARQNEIDVLVSDQAIDRWRGLAGPSVTQVCRELYVRGVSFRLVSVLRPQDLAATDCKRLLLLDSHLPDNPDGTSPVRAALRAFAERGGQILCLSEKPFQALYGASGAHGIPATVHAGKTAEEIWPAIQSFLPAPALRASAEGDVIWRQFRASGRRFVLLVATGSEAARNVRVEGATSFATLATDALRPESRGTSWTADGLPTHALLELVAPR